MKKICCLEKWQQGDEYCQLFWNFRYIKNENNNKVN